MLAKVMEKQGRTRHGKRCKVYGKKSTTQVTLTPSPRVNNFLHYGINT